MAPPRNRKPLPTLEEVLDYVRENPDAIARRDITRAFNIRGSDHKGMSKMFRQLEDEGLLGQKHRRAQEAGSELPPVGVIELTGLDPDGEMLARPQNWDEAGASPRIYLVASGRKDGSAPALGDRVLARLKRQDDGTYLAHTIQRLQTASRDVFGVYRADGKEGRLIPADRRVKTEFIVTKKDSGGALPGELVRAQSQPGKRMGLPYAIIVERLGAADAPGAASLLAASMRSIPLSFPNDVLGLADNCKAAPMGARTDLRNIGLVTIDDVTARDFDDAVWAEADPAPDNPGGWVILVAIADVSWYVRPGDKLDNCARERGNSVYFPDRVSPMLPQTLSNGWCSLKPDEDRPVLAVRMWIDAQGDKLRHEFMRGMMRSSARLTYNQVQQARDGKPDDHTAPMVETVIKPLYGAFHALRSARDARGALDLDLPERIITMRKNGTIEKIELRKNLDSHQLIEEFMIAANVSAAETLEQREQPCMYRVHDTPEPDRIENLRSLLDSIGLKLSRGKVLRAGDFNQIVEKARPTPHSALVSEAVLRCQAQAVYSPENLGHFGLGLRRYAHFTSPIRRYADLLVHRALITGLGLGDGGLDPQDGSRFAAIALSISDLERRAAAAERDAADRLTVAYLADKTGAIFDASVNGITRFGAFVVLVETRANGLIPFSALGDERFRVDEQRQALVGARGRIVIRMGDTLKVRLVDANPLTGSMIFEPLNRKKSGNSGKKTTPKHRKGAKRKRRQSSPE